MDKMTLAMLEAAADQTGFPLTVTEKMELFGEQEVSINLGPPNPLKTKMDIRVGWYDEAASMAVMVHKIKGRVYAAHYYDGLNDTLTTDLFHRGKFTQSNLSDFIKEFEPVEVMQQTLQPAVFSRSVFQDGTFMSHQTFEVK